MCVTSAPPWSRLCDEPPHEVQSGHRRAAADRRAIAREVEAEAALAHRTARVQEDEPDRFLLATAVRAGDARPRDGHVAAEPVARAARHRGGGLGGDGTVLTQELVGHTEL